MRLLLVLAALAAAAPTAGSQLLRDVFRSGAAPAGWTFTSATGTAAAPRTSNRERGIAVVGNGGDMTWWQRRVPGLAPRKTYRIRFSARASGPGSTGCVIAGLDSCNRDFSVSQQWKAYGFVFTTPDDVSRSVLRLGQWHWKGAVRFESVQLSEIATIHRATGGRELGACESIDETGYHFLSDYPGPASNGDRALVRHAAAFNSNRWVFADGAEVVYRHDAAGAPMASARLRVSIGLVDSGCVTVLASRDGLQWVEAGHAESLGRTFLDAPASLFPTKQLFVRLAATASPTSTGAEPRVSLQVVGYRMDARLAVPAARAAGSTTYLDVLAADPAVGVRVLSLGSLGRDTAEPLALELRSPAHVAGHAIASLALRPASGRAAAFTGAVRLRPGLTTLKLPYRWSGTGRVDVALNVMHLSDGNSRRLFSATSETQVSSYYDSEFGYALTPTPAGPLWWCEDTYKVNPTRVPPAPVPGAGAMTVRMSAARREREHAQVILRPTAAPGPIQVSASDLRDAKGRRIPSSAVQVREVAYLTVDSPTDSVGATGDWPDPLPPLDGPWRPRAGRNNPLWITVTVPAGAVAGDYSGQITLKAARWSCAVPLRLHVWNFTLPEQIALRSGFGISPGSIRKYHNLESDASLEKVWDFYMQAFRRIHLAPYDPMALAGYSVKQTGPATVDIDFSRFDAAARRYLDGCGFNAFTIDVLGLGNGRHPKYNHGSFLGKAAGTAEYDALMADYGRKLTDHLRANGWIDKAYVYWYDEPSDNDYQFCQDGMERLRKYTPGLKRMLTEQVEEPLTGYVDLWCPITESFQHERTAARQKLGEEIWWYVCTGPKEPYATLFIDHPAIDLRMWLWQTWKYNVQGILIWQTNHWNSPVHNKGPEVQDPWVDPMSYSDSDGMWGNGDGRFFYPPRRDPNVQSDREYIEPPTVAMRWEMLGQGVEDWMYFRMLSDLVAAARARGDRSPEVQTAARLLTVPSAICRDMTTFTLDPQPLFRHRAALATAIETLSARGGRR